MALILSAAARNAAVDSVTALFNANGGGTIEIGTGTPASFGSVLATLILSNPSFWAAGSGSGTPASTTGLASAKTITPDTNTSGTGTAGAFRIKDGSGNVIISGSVGTSAADIIFSSVSFTPGGTCSISSLTLSCPAS